MSEESNYIHKRHNVSVLLYHLVCAAKYRKVVITEPVDKVLKEVCIDIAKRYEINFLEIGTDKDHVHFLIQSVPSNSPTKLVTTIKSITAKEIFKRVPEVKKQLWGGEFWGKGFFINTVGQHGTEQMIANYVKGQGMEYLKLYEEQLTLF